MLSDQGPSVDGSEVRTFLGQFCIREIGIRTVKQTNRWVIAEHDLEVSDWTSILPRIGYLPNSDPSSSTGFLHIRSCLEFGTHAVHCGG